MTFPFLIQFCVGLLVVASAKCIEFAFGGLSVTPDARSKGELAQGRTPASESKPNRADRGHQHARQGPGNAAILYLGLAVALLATMFLVHCRAPDPVVANIYLYSAEGAAFAVPDGLVCIARNGTGREARVSPRGVFWAPPSDWGPGTMLSTSLHFEDGASVAHQGAIEDRDGIFALILPWTAPELNARVEAAQTRARGRQAPGGEARPALPTVR